MKKILIIDGGPRKKFYLAQLLESFTEGAKVVRSHNLKTGFTSSPP